jgi:hypothetical protein
MSYWDIEMARLAWSIRHWYIGVGLIAAWFLLYWFVERKR